MINIKLVLNNITWNHLTVSKQQSPNWFRKSYQQTIHLKIIYIYIYIENKIWH